MSVFARNNDQLCVYYFYFFVGNIFALVYWFGLWINLYVKDGPLETPSESFCIKFNDNFKIIRQMSVLGGLEHSKYCLY